MRTAVRIIISFSTPYNGFRYYAQRKGRELGLTGNIICNGKNGGITIHAEGPENVLQKYTSILRSGTPFCRVSSLMAMPERLLNYLYFDILPTPETDTESKKHTTGFRGLRTGIFGL